MSMKRSTLWALGALVGGLMLGTALVAYYGVGAVGGALARTGWRGFAAVVLIHLAILVVCGIAWWVLVPPPRAPVLTFVWGRLVRDSGSELLPLSQIGGYVVGARAVAVRGVSGAIALGSTVVDVTMELVGQIAYTVLGLVLLLRLRPDSALAVPVGIGIAIAIALAVAFIYAQQRGVEALEHMAERLAQRWLAGRGNAGAVQAAVARIWRHPSGLRWGFALHLFTWIASGLEVWVALQFMGRPLDFAAVLAIESLVYATRSVAFVVPNAFGVQEGAYVMVGALFGLSPQTALAVSLIKRGRDLVLGVPALLAWQSFEGRRLVRRPAEIPLAGEREG
jgi:putative membrane protein